MFIPACSILGLAGLVIVSGSAHAEVSTGYKLTADVAESGLSITLGSSSGTLYLAAPYTGAASSSTQTQVTVSARNGYQLFMVSNSDSEGNHPLVDSTSGYTIPTLSSTCNAGCNIANDSSFAPNYWGFNVGARNATNESTSYRGFPSGTYYYSIGEYSGDVSDSYTLNFGAKVNYEQEAGTYTNTINFVAVASIKTTKLYMQFMNNDATDCPTTGATVYDSRDDTAYEVKRLADGKCWMLDNLALDPTIDTVKASLSPLNTNADADSIAAFKVGATVAGVTGANYATEGVTTTWETSTENWTIPRINTTDTDTLFNSNYGEGKPSITGRKIGAYYNYCAISAGSYCYAGDAGTGNVSKDICPAGWRLPTGGDDKTASSTSEFVQLYRAYGSSLDINSNAFNSPMIAALQVLLSGDFRGSSTYYYKGTRGHLWSSTFKNPNYMYILYANGSSTDPASSYYRSLGYPARCVMDS